MRTLYSRAPNNDAFWETKRTQSVEVTYYRYMRFFNDGRVLYALSTTHPSQMALLLKNFSPQDKKVYDGFYTLTGRRLDVQVFHTLIYKLKCYSTDFNVSILNITITR
jgi:hypothetical protein